MEKSVIFNNSSNNKGVFGFDLGTTNSVVSVYDSDGIPIVLSTESGGTTPSCVMFNEDGTHTVGRSAYFNKMNLNVAYSFKKYMGSNKKIPIIINDKKMTFTAREISEIFIKEVFKQVYTRSPKFAGIRNIVISVPAYFDVHQTSDTKQAFMNCGFNVISVQPEPVSAALVFQKIKRISDPILVFDLGGGTFDAVLIQNELGFPKDSISFYDSNNIVLPESKDCLSVIDITGNNKLGGDDIDRYTVESFFKYHNIKGSVDRELIFNAEAVKISQGVMDIEVDGNMYKMNYDHVISGTKKVLKQCLELTDKLLSRNGINKVHCVLCGGTTKSPIVREELEKRFKCSYDIDPDLAVGIGDTMFGSESGGILVLSRVAKHLGVIVDNKFVPVVRKGDIIPASKLLPTSNTVPYADNLEITFYQTEDVQGDLTPVHKLRLDGITNFNNKGYALINIEVVITLDGIVTVSAENDGKKLEASFGSSNLEQNENTLSMSKAQKWYRRFERLIIEYDIDYLDDLMIEFRETEDMLIGNKIHKEIMRYKND